MQDNQLIKIANPFEPFKRECLPVAYEPGRSIRDLIKLSGFGDSVLVILNGKPIDNYDCILFPGDVVHIYPQLHGGDSVRSVSMIAIAVIASYFIGPAVAAGAGGGFWGGLAGAAAATATITVGGMIVNSGLSAPGSGNSKTFEESPTYQWDLKENPAREGLAIPVIYGQVASYPPVINQWLGVTDGEQWAHTVLCVGEGLTNNVPTADDIYVGDQPLSMVAEDDYTLVTTDGGPSPAWGGATDFTTPHQMRSIDRQMKHAVVASVLLHCNGTNGSKTIVESSGESNTWTCMNTAQLSTTTPKFGTACLDLETIGGYVSCNNSDAFDIWTTEFMSIECWFQQDTLTNSAIMGQSRVVFAGDEYYWGLFYDHDNTQIVFQQYKVDSAGSYTVYYNCNWSFSASAGTWYHICIQKWGADRVWLYRNGTRHVDTFWDLVPLVDPPAGAWGQALGGAKFYSTGPEADTQWWGECRLDEVRIIKEGVAYRIKGFTAPTTELVDTADEEYYYTTQGTIEKFGVILSAPFGLVWYNDDGSLDPYYIPFHISYRLVGESDWVTSYELFYATSRNPYRSRFDYTVPVRGQYEIKIRRSGVDDSNTKAVETTVLSYIDEYLDMTLTYPYLQCIGISLKAQSEFSGTIPPFRVISNRSSIVVPNYNESGTQTVDPTTNPYAVLDMLTNDVYGSGLAATRIVEDDFDDWATYCTGLVATYQRAQLNIIFDAVSTLDDALQQVEACGRAKIIKRGSKISCNIDQPSSAVALFGYGNVKQDSDHIRWIRQAERPDGVEVSYRDIDLNYSEETVTAYSSGYHTLTRVPRVVRMSIPGINNAEQATREAILRQQINDSVKKTLEFESGLEAIPVQSGDVINYQGSIKAFTGRLPRYSDRTEQWTGTTVYLDGEINLASATYSGNCILMVRDPDDTIRTYTVTGPFDSDEWYVTVSVAGTFDYLSPYIICRNTGDVYQYKVTDMKRSGQLDIKLECLQYDSTAYYHANYEAGTVVI